MTRSDADDHAFLGEDFLVWLWWQAETRGGVYDVGDGERIGIALERVLEFFDEPTGVRVVVRGDAPTRAPEAREALSRGMRLLRAGLIVTVGEDNVSVVVDGPTLDLRSVKGPRPEGSTREERDAAALSTLFGLTEALDAVYRAYLAKRIASDFATTTATELVAWARSAPGRSGRMAADATRTAAPLDGAREASAT